jgi:tetratricopeptide (TPR) repeat protein
LDLTENMINQPGKGILFAHRAYNLLKTGELDEAIKVCERGLKHFPTYAQGHYILARCYIKKKLNDEARAELERVLRYEPNHIKTIRDLAGLHFANGFQDLYREYLMQLFTLDPLNEQVIEEAKKLGEYNLWKAEPDSVVQPEPMPQSEVDLESVEDNESLFLETEQEKTKEDPIFPDKIDLSQFDNVEDDFTTILHGKMQYPRKANQSEIESDSNLVDIAKDIIEEPTVEDQSEDSKTDEVSTEDKPLIESATTVSTTDETQKSNPVEDQTDTVADHLDVKDHFSEKGEDAGSSSRDIEIESETMDEPELNSETYDDEEDDKFEQPKIISQTLGEILVSQQKYVEAKAVFEALKEKQPDNKALDLKIEYLNRIIGLENKGKS